MPQTLNEYISVRGTKIFRKRLSKCKLGHFLQFHPKIAGWVIFQEEKNALQIWGAFNSPDTCTSDGRKHDGKTNYDQVKSRKKVWRLDIFGGQNCRNFDLVPKILSAEKFCPPKILSAEILSDKV